MTDELPIVCPRCNGILTFGYIQYDHSTQLLCLDCKWTSEWISRDIANRHAQKLAMRGIQECLLKIKEKENPERYT